MTGYAYDATSVYGYPGPLLTGPPVDDAWRTEFAAWFRNVCAELSVLTVFIRNHPIYDASDAFAVEPFARSAPTPTVAIDLAPPAPERLARADSHHRRALRKSLAHGLTYERDHGDAAIAGFTACYLETMAKHDAAEAYLLDEERVATMLATLGDHAELWVARKPAGGSGTGRTGEIASAAIFLVTDTIMQYHLGGTRTADFELGAARPLFEAVAESGHERGLKWLHLGGGVGGADDSLLRYKRGFGPDRFEYRTIRAVLDVEAYDKGTRAVNLDPDRGFFPAYRTTGMGVCRAVPRRPPDVCRRPATH